MLQYCLDKWNQNKDLLKEHLKNDPKLNYCEYSYLVELVVEYILNSGEKNGRWDSKNITEIDNGDYQGTKLFLIPRNTYQPSEYEYLMTYAGYGSCCSSDTLLSIRDQSKQIPTEAQVKDFMALCKDLVTNMIKPYNDGWRQEAGFEEVAMV